MSQLFLATEASLNRQVVIKLLPPEMASEVSAARFKQEMEVAAHLQHPHVLPVLSAGGTDDLFYYVMPFVAGESLRHRLEREGRLPVQEAVRILTEVADALAYAHARGVLHRDIKPENILLQEGHAVLTDFGVARAIEQAKGTTRLTEVGTAVGTPGYMAPEQAAGDAHIDARADIYALGIVGYEMLAGEQPFKGATPAAIMAAHFTEVPQPVHTLQPDTPPSVSAAIARALAKEPGERFQSAGELRDALRTETRTALRSGLSKRVLVTAAAAVVVVAAVVAFALWPKGYTVEGDPRQSIIVFPFENKTGASENDYLEEASMNLLGLAVGHWEDMRVYDDERTNSLLRRRKIETTADIDFDAAQSMAQDARVGTFVLGDIRRDGDSLAIEAKVHDVANGDRLMTEIVRAPPSADPRPLFDSLAARILHVSGAPAGERPDLLTQTTSSLEAYRQYLAGTEALQLFEIDSAKVRFRGAVELDSTFALAYIQLRNVDGWRGIEQNPEIRRALVAKAVAYSDNLPLRYRLLVQFHSAYEAGQFGRARRIAEQMIARDSNDVEAWYQLGEAHFHDGAGRWPHPDTLGNMGKALHAFQRTLALDSAYVLAYLHLTDVLGNCAANNPWLCRADSAVYGSQQDLIDRYGAKEVERSRSEANRSRLEAAYAWVEAAPASQRARAALLDLLLDRDRYAEAGSQIAVLRAEGRTMAAASWESRVKLRRREYAEAGLLAREAIGSGPAALRQLFVEQQDPSELFEALIAAAFLEDMENFVRNVLAVVPTDTVNANNVRLSKALFAQFFTLGTVVAVGADSATVRTGTHAWLDTLDRYYPPGSDDRQRQLEGSGTTVLSAYLATRDTTLLSRFLTATDTTGSRTWRTMLAHLALQRGDSATARARLDTHFRKRDSVETAGDPGSRRLFAWADLLAQLGELSEAVTAYELFDSLEPGRGAAMLHVRSWAERGALYQQLGETAPAIEMYEKFITAWANGDEVVQPLVARARQAVAALRGETREPLR
jgi:tetratricopeptide (TPR) repeat protein